MVFKFGVYSGLFDPHWWMVQGTQSFKRVGVAIFLLDLLIPKMPPESSNGKALQLSSPPTPPPYRPP